MTDVFLKQALFLDAQKFSPNRLHKTVNIWERNKCFSVALEQRKTNAPFPLSPASYPPRAGAGRGTQTPRWCPATPAAGWVGAAVPGSQSSPALTTPGRPPASPSPLRWSRSARAAGTPGLALWPHADSSAAFSRALLSQAALPPQPLRAQKAPEEPSLREERSLLVPNQASLLALGAQRPVLSLFPPEIREAHHRPAATHLSSGAELPPP